MSITNNNENSIELSDDMEDGDDAFYYEVEEIIQMHVTENGTRMFEIKWKNYEPEHNTWEPEHNLNCPSILKAFLEKNGYSQKPEKKKKKRKLNKPKAIDDVETDYFKDSDVEISSNNKETDIESEKKKKKTTKEPTPALQQLLNKKNEKKEKQKKKKQAEEDNISDIARGLDELRNSQQSKSQEEPKKVVEETSKKPEEPKKRVEETPKKVEEPRKRVEEPVKTTSFNSDKPVSKPTIPLRITAEKQPQRAKHDSSFTVLKRGSFPKPAPNTDLKDILDSMNPQPPPQRLTFKQHQFKISPTPRKHFEANNKLNPSNVTPSTNQSVHVPSQPSPSSPKIPYLPPPSTPSPSPPHQQSVNRNTSVIPTKNAMEWQSNDPRIRQRLQASNQTHPTADTQPITRPLTVQHDPHAIKRQLSKDPRMKPDNIKRLKNSNATAIPTPFGMDVALYNGSKFIANVNLEGKKSCYHEVKIKALLTAISSNEIRITNTIPLKSLNAVLKDRPISFLSISPKDHIVDVSKLKSYYQVNEMAGVLHHPNLPQALVVLAEADLKKLSNVDRDSLDLTAYTPLTVLFIDELMARPKFLDTDIHYEFEANDNSTPFAWQRVTEYLRFPDHLTKLSSKAKFLIYGHSDTASMLTKASSMLRPAQQPQPSYVMMFDRYNDTMFSRNLTKHKKEPSTQIWEFGAHNFSEGKMTPAKQIFPNNTGGFVTTNMENIVHNPNIITDISVQVEKFNSMPSLYGEWKFILPFNWVEQLKKLVKDTESGQRVKEAIISITIALSSDSVSILRLWCTDTENPTCVQYLDRLAREKYTTHQYFVHVDDIDSVPANEQPHSIDFVNSSKLFSTFV